MVPRGWQADTFSFRRKGFFLYFCIGNTQCENARQTPYRVAGVPVGMRGGFCPGGKNAPFAHQRHRERGVEGRFPTARSGVGACWMEFFADDKQRHVLRHRTRECPRPAYGKHAVATADGQHIESERHCRKEDNRDPLARIERVPPGSGCQRVGQRPVVAWLRARYKDL